MLNSVLLIDDNDIDNHVNKTKILKCGFARKIHMVSSAKNGIKFLQDRGNTHDQLPNIIFLDIKMPEIDGFGFLALYHQLDEKIKSKCQIVMLTASIDYIDFKRATSNQYVTNYLKKPLNTEEIIALIMPANLFG